MSTQLRLESYCDIARLAVARTRGEDPGAGAHPVHREAGEKLRPDLRGCAATHIIHEALVFVPTLYIRCARVENGKKGRVRRKKRDLGHSYKKYVFEE